MYKVLIADDDLPVRLDLRMLIDWQAFDIELLEDAVDGSEVIENVSRNSPDIIILDLGMPILNGLEVLKKLKENKFGGKVIVLSCHDDFTSVSEALKTGASDYLLKHMLKKENLLVCIKNTLKTIENEKRENIEKQRKDILNEMSIQALKKSFVADFVSGVYRKREDAQMFLEKLGVSLEFHKFVIVQVQIDDLYRIREKYSYEEFGNFLKSAENLLKSLFEGTSCLYGATGEGEYSIILDFSASRSYMGINAAIYEVCERIRIECHRQIKLKVSVGISRICTDTGFAGECFAQARKALEGRLYMGKNRLIHYSEIENYSGKMDNSVAFHENEISKMVFSSEPKDIEEGADRIFFMLKSKNFKPEYMKSLCVELLMKVDKIAVMNSVDIFKLYGEDSLYYNNTSKLETLEDIRNLFLSVCLNLNHILAERSQASAKTKVRQDIKKALEYMSGNYMKDIELQDVADHAGLSRTYFSQMFKQEMGMNFTDYLCRLRIDRARDMLTNTGMKIYEVAESCGFSNYRYFIRVFKELTGKPPHAFKNQTY